MARRLDRSVPTEIVKCPQLQDQSQSTLASVVPIPYAEATSNIEIMPSQFDSLLESPASRICVIAAPGSGKTTHLLIPKTKALLADPAIKPEEVLLLTFSRLSAQDLKKKVADLDRIPQASTVHSLALSFLISENNHQIRARIESLLLDFEKEILASDLKAIFPARHKTQSIAKDLKRFSAGWATKPHDDVFVATEEERAFKNALINWLQEHKAAMMEEILYFAVELARHVPDSRLLNKAKHILVDEYQDLNELEQAFIEILSSNSKTTLVVGDPDQSIYSFKFAHPKGILDFSTSKDTVVQTSLETWRCPSLIVEYANQLLKQIDPLRTDLLRARSDAARGTVDFIRKDTQEHEFQYVLRSIADRLISGTPAHDIIVLVPRKQLGADFVTFANSKIATVGIPAANNFCLSLKPEFNVKEQERILLLALVARRSSVLHTRAYLGLEDSKTHYATEMNKLKEKYGSLEEALEHASSGDFTTVRLKRLTARLEGLRSFLANHDEAIDVGNLIDELFPPEEVETRATREMLIALLEEGDNVSKLYGKFVDYMRTIPSTPAQVRVMTLMSSKGLEAEHVYMMGCNAGNIPGDRRAEHLTDLEHRHEQIRFMYVGFTRSKNTLAVSWSRLLPFAQSKKHNTPGVATVRRGGLPMRAVGVCEFIQNLDGVTWQ